MLLHDKGKIQYADEMHAQRHETMFLGGYTFAWGIWKSHAWGKTRGAQGMPVKSLKILYVTWKVKLKYVLMIIKYICIKILVF